MQGIRTYVAALVGLVGLMGTAGAVPTPFFDTVASFAPGTGSGVVDYHDPISSYTGPSGPGTFDPTAVAAVDRVRLALGGATGIPGSIVLGFSDGREFFGDGGPTPDVQVYGYPIDRVRVEFSYDGATFFHGQPTGGMQEQLSSGYAVYSWLFDLDSTSLASAKFLRITTKPFLSVGSYPDGYELDAAKALHFESPAPPAPTPEPSTWVLLGTGLLSLLGYGWRQRRPTP